MTGPTTEARDAETRSTEMRNTGAHGAPTSHSGTPAAPSVGWSFLRERRWLGYGVLLLIFSVCCVMLGNWQFERRAEARAEIDRIDRNYDAPAMPLADVMPDSNVFDEHRMKWQTIEVRGEYEGEIFLARNRPGPDGVGSNLVQALRLDDGRVFFIDRGWVPVSGTDVVPSGLPSASTGLVTVEARLRAGEPPIAGREASGSSVPSIYPEMLAELSGVGDEAVLAAYGQLVSETPSGQTGVLAERPERDEGPHLSYALQWYVFILIGIAGVAYGARQDYRTLNAGDDSEHGEALRRDDRRRAERRLRRGPTDSDEEDAIIDG